jgi:hypothetical protein
MGKLIAVVLVLAALGGGAWYLQTSGAFVEEELAAAAPIEPPAGAVVLGEEVDPSAIVTAVLGARTPQEQQEAIDSFRDCWLPERGWDGEAEEVKVSGGVTRFAVEVHDPKVVGMCFVVCEVPGAVEGLENGKLVRFRGRIKDVRESPDLMTQPHRVYLDEVTALRVQ